MGRAGGRRAGAARDLPDRRRGARPAPATSAAPRRPSRARHVRGQPGVSVRGLLAQPPADPVRAGEQATFAVDSRGRPFRWRIFRVGERASAASKGRRQTGGELPGPRARRRVGRLRAQGCAPPALDGGPVRGPGRRRARRSSSSCPRSPGSAATRSTTTATGCRTRSTTAAPPPTRGCLPGGLPAGFPDEVAAAARLPRRAEDPLRRHDRPDAGRDPRGAVRRAPGRAARRPAALDLQRPRAPAAPLRQRGRPASRRSAPTRCAAASRSRATGCCARCRRPTPTRSGRGCARSAGCRAATPLQPIADEGDTGLLTGVEQLPGLLVVEESDPSRAGASASRSPRSTRRRSSGRRRRTSRCRRTSRRSRSREVGDGTGDPRRAARVGRAGSARARVPVQQLTRNIADILRGAKPKIRSF